MSDPELASTSAVSSELPLMQQDGRLSFSGISLAGLEIAFFTLPDQIPVNVVRGGVNSDSRPDLGNVLESPATAQMLGMIDELMAENHILETQNCTLSETVAALKGDLFGSRAEIKVLQNRLEEAEIKIAELEKIANQDSLTGAGTRRLWDDQIQPEIVVAMEKGISEGDEILFGFLDADNFGILNKKFGHPVGDKILQNLVFEVDGKLKRIQGQVSFCRYGGDEFVFVIRLCNYGEEAIEETINVFETEIYNIAQPGRCSEDLGFGLSCAVVRLTKFDNLDDALTAVNKKMYENKRIRIGDRRKNM